MNKLFEKEIRPNGHYFNLLFAAYYLALAPFINQIIMFGERNILVALFGLLVYAAEFFSFNIKTKMVRFRAVKEKMRIKRETGKDIIIPGPGCVIGYGVFTRMLFRIGFIMVAMMSFGADVSNELSPFFLGVLITAILFECGVLAYTFSESGVMGSTVDTSNEEDKEKSLDEIWYEKNKVELNSQEWGKKEFYSDIVLHLYAFMLFTAFWNPINGAAIEFIQDATEAGDGALSTFLLLLFMQGTMAILALPPIRLAYWIEESTKAFTPKHKWKLRGSFFLASAVIASPALQEYIKAYFLK